MPSDVLLVHKTLCGDEKAYHRLMKKYETNIYTFILSLVKNPEDAEEITDDVFWKAYQNLSSLKEPSRFYPWILKIAKNQCQDWQRKKQASFLSLHEVSATAKIPPVDELLLLREAISKVLQAMEMLPEVEKGLLKARYMEDASYEELQSRHGLSYKAIAMRLFKAKRKVREKVEKILSGIVAFPWEDAIKKLFLGGIEAMKISATTKLVTVWTATLLIVGGIAVSVWHTKPPKKEMSKPIATQSAQEMPTKSYSPSFSEPKLSVTPIQKPLLEQYSEQEIEEAPAWLDSLKKEEDLSPTEVTSEVVSDEGEETEKEYDETIARQIAERKQQFLKIKQAQKEAFLEMRQLPKMYQEGTISSSEFEARYSKLNAEVAAYGLELKDLYEQLMKLVARQRSSQ